MTDTMNSRELAAKYGFNRDAMENVLGKIKPKRYGTTEPTYDPGEVADLLAAQDSQAEQEIIKALDEIQNDELAEHLLIQGVEEGRTRLEVRFCEKNERAVDNARRAIVGEVVARVPYTTRQLRCQWQSAGNVDQQADREWELLADFQAFRDRLVQALRQRRTTSKT